MIKVAPWTMREDARAKNEMRYNSLQLCFTYGDKGLRNKWKARLSVKWAKQCCLWHQSNRGVANRPRLGFFSGMFKTLLVNFGVSVHVDNDLVQDESSILKSSNLNQQKIYRVELFTRWPTILQLELGLEFSLDFELVNNRLAVSWSLCTWSTSLTMR